MDELKKQFEELQNIEPSIVEKPDCKEAEC